MASNATQLFLLADHVKLSLLERQRAISLNLAPNTQDNQISRSLESLREGLESLESSSTAPDASSDLSRLRSQYHDLSRQFHGDNPSSTAAETLKSPNNPSLAADFSHAQSRTPNTTSTTKQQSIPSNQKPPVSEPATAKSVRFRDDPSSKPSYSDNEEDTANRTALFPPGRYRDDPSSTPDDPTQLSNQQIHAHHSQILAEQDSQLDTLSASINRQQQLSMQMGDELEGQAVLLDDVERGVDRHQGRLDGARRRLEGVSRKARENWGMTTIVVLIVVLVFLIVVLK